MRQAHQINKLIFYSFSVTLSRLVGNRTKVLRAVLINGSLADSGSYPLAAVPIAKVNAYV
jgi:hypothetical protein